MYTFTIETDAIKAARVTLQHGEPSVFTVEGLLADLEKYQTALVAIRDTCIGYKATRLAREALAEE